MWEADALEIAALRAAVQERLPAYMVPSAWAVQEQLPLTANGKVDRRALAALQDIGVKGGLQAPTKGLRDTLELVMVQLWAQVLGVRQVNIDDNFFDIGGHSLKVVALRELIRQHWQVEIPVSAFFMASTPSALCDWIRAHQHAIPASLVVLPRGVPDRPPLVLVHEVSGGVLDYLDLCAALGSEQPVYGLVAPGYDTDEDPLESVHHLARRYVQEVRRAMVDGPYRIVGWSFGGLVAFEMARLLEAEGAEVDLLGLIDAHPFGAGVSKKEHHRISIIQKIASRLDLDAVEFEAEATEAAMDRLVRAVEERQIVPATVARVVMARQIRVMEAHTMAIDDYRPSGLVRANLTLFAAQDADQRRWADRTRGTLRVVPVPGNHWTMVHAPYVKSLAAGIKDCLAACQGGLNQESEARPAEGSLL